MEAPAAPRRSLLLLDAEGWLHFKALPPQVDLKLRRCLLGAAAAAAAIERPQTE